MTEATQNKDNALDNGALTDLEGQEGDNKDDKGEGEGDKKDKGEIKDQRLESALGRITGMQSKVNGLEGRFTSLDDKLAVILDTVTPQVKEPDHDEDWVPPVSKTEFDAQVDQRVVQQIDQSKKTDDKYNDDYMVTLGKLAQGEEKETHEAIIKEMMDNFNVRRSGDGALDADVNYSKASRAYFKKQLGLKDKVNPLKGPGEGQPPLGGGLEGEEMVGKETPMPKLDEYAKDFVEKTGMKEDSVKAALKGEAPSGLQTTK